MNFNFIFQSNTATLIAALSLIVGICTFLLGYVAYKKVLLRPFREKQLTAVCDLINRINLDFNWFAFHNSVKAQPSRPYCTLFDIAELSEDSNEINFYSFGTEDESHFPTRVNNPMEYQKFSEIMYWEFFRFHNDPLLPKSIATTLKKFNVSHPNSSKAKKYGELKKNEKYVIIGKKINVDDDSPCLYYDEQPTWNDFIKLCKELKASLSIWGEKYGIDDMNISPSHHFNSNEKSL